MPSFVNKNVLAPFAVTYIFVYCIHTKYIDAQIHQGLNPRPHEGSPHYEKKGCFAIGPTTHYTYTP